MFFSALGNTAPPGSHRLRVDFAKPGSALSPLVAEDRPPRITEITKALEACQSEGLIFDWDKRTHTILADAGYLLNLQPSLNTAWREFLSKHMDRHSPLARGRIAPSDVTPAQVWNHINQLVFSTAKDGVRRIHVYFYAFASWD